MVTTSEPDVLNAQAQGKFINTLSTNMVKEAKKGISKTPGEMFQISKVFDALEEALRDSYADDTYLEELRRIKADPDILKMLKHFADSLEGNANITQIKGLVDTITAELPDVPGTTPPPKPEADVDSGPTIDVGLNNMVFTGDVDSKGVNDLQRFSNYLSGAGSTFGGVVADLPSTLVGLTKSSLGYNMRRYLELQESIEEFDLEKVLNKIEMETKSFFDFTGQTPEEAKMEIAANPAKRSSVLKSALKDVNAANGRRKNLVMESQIKTANMEDLKIKFNAKIRARKILQKVAGGVKGVGAVASGALGGVDIAAGTDVIGNAESLYNSGSIDKEEYDDMMQDGRFRIAQGAFGIGEGINAVRELVTKKVVKNASKLVGTAKMGYRFASMVGGAIAIGAGITSIAKNAMAAHDAEEEGNIGKAAMYGIMAGLDCVSVILDGVSVALDFVPGIGTAISFAVDIVNTVVNIVGMAMGFFADMVDTRTSDQKLQSALDDYVESTAFVQFMDKQASFFEEEGYDIFQYIINAEAVDLSEDGADAAKIDKTVSRKLSARAREDFDAPNLRLALIDGSTLGRELRGRCGDDIIRAGVGDDTVYGGKGDDLLFGEADNDTMYGGPGNDYLHAGTGKDILFGEEGDDTLAFTPGATKTVDGGVGTDTASILSLYDTWMNGLQGSRGRPKGIVGVYVDISKADGRAGVALGSLLYGDSVVPSLHFPAFDSECAAHLKSDLLGKFFGHGSQAVMTLESFSKKYLWYLADINEPQISLKIFTDGMCLYAVGTKNGITGKWKEANFIPNIRESDVISIDKRTNAGTILNQKELEAWFYLAFKGTYVKDIERITISQESARCQVLGSAQDNLINIGNGGDAVVYTGEGNNLVSCKGTPTVQLKASRCIIGGSGQNTLVINTGRGKDISYGKNYVLLEPNTNMSTAVKHLSPALWNGDMVEGSLFVVGMKTVQCNINAGNTIIDGSNQTGPLGFVVNATCMFTLIGTQADNSIYLSQIGNGCGSTIRAYGGKNYLSLEHINKNQLLGIDLEEDKTIYGVIPHPRLARDGRPVSNKSYAAVCVKVRDVTSIRGNLRTVEMKGHWNANNLFVANGRASVIEPRGGANTVICMRGQHSVIGGTGCDNYIIHGPRVTEQITVSILRVETPGLASQETGIKATTSVYGTWNWNSAELELNIGYEIADGMEVTSIQIVDAQGNQVTNKGTVELMNGNRLARYKPQSYFNGLKKNGSETIRIKFETKGSYVSIVENNSGNRIEFKNFQDTQVRLVINPTTDALEFWSNTNELIVIDRFWATNFRMGMSSIDKLCFEFAQRFAELKFTNSEYAGKEVISFLWSRLNYLVPQSNHFDNIVDARLLSSPVELGEGNDVLLARRKRMTYITGEGNDFIDISTFDAPSNGTGTDTKVVTGRGDDLVVVGMNSETVKIQFAADGDSEAFGEKTLLLKDIEVNSFRVSRRGNGYEFGQNPPFVSFDVPPSLIVFDRTKRTGKTIVITNVNDFLEKRMANLSFVYRMIFNADGEMYLNASGTDSLDNLKLEINVEGDLPTITIRDDSDVFYSFKLYVPFHKVINAGTVANAIWQHCKGGIQFKSSTIKDKQLKQGIVSMFSKDKYPRRYNLLGAEPKAMIVTMSNSLVTYAMNKYYIQIQPEVRNVGIQGNPTLLFLPGRIASSVSLHSSYSGKELRVGTEVICEMTGLPQMCVFQANDEAEYEILDSNAMSNLGSTYAPRWFASKNELVYLDLSEYRSSEVSVTMYAEVMEMFWMRLYAFHPARLMHNNTEVATITASGMGGSPDSGYIEKQLDAQRQGLQFSSHLPGGIRYSDKVVSGGELVHYFASAVYKQVFKGRYTKTLEEDEQAVKQMPKSTTLVFDCLKKLTRSVEVIS